MLAWSALNWPDKHVNESEAIRAEMRKQVASLVMMLLILAFLMTMLAMFGMQENEKFSFLVAITSRLPHFTNIVLGIANGIQANEIAGMLVVVLPLLVSLSVASLCERKTFLKDSGSIPGKAQQWFFSIPSLFLFMLLFLMALLLTESRSGLLAFSVSCLFLFALMGKRGLIVLGICILIITGGVFLIGADRIVDSLLYAGKPEGLTFHMLLTGRTEIWMRAGFAILDFPITGIGLGTYAPVISVLYPFDASGEIRPLADAHNLYLQTALDFGVGGLLVYIAFLAALLMLLHRIVRTFHPRTFTRALALGAGGSLVAHITYSLTDAVAMGARAGILFWFLTGIIGALYNTEREGRLGARFPKEKTILLGFVLAGAAYIFAPDVQQLVRYNAATIEATKALVREPEKLKNAAWRVNENSGSLCQSRWLLGQLLGAMGNTPEQRRVLAQLVSCTDRYIPLLRIVAPDDFGLARHAVNWQRDNSAAYFWLAETLVKTDTATAIQMYHEGLKRDPSDGLAWRYLGDLFVRAYPHEAIRCYLRSCRNGDPGANGCGLAGRTAERMGDVRNAIRYYRMSRYHIFRKRADILEMKLQQGVIPESAKSEKSPTAHR